MYVIAASRPRCLVVASGLTAALWGAAALLVRAGAGPAPGADRVLVRLCLAALLLAAGWAWLQAMAGVADAWRGAPSTGSSGLRRLTTLVCGVALAAALVAPAHAGGHRPRPAPLSGLPLPDRAEGPAVRHHSGVRADAKVVVHTGDSLWLLAERDLGPPASDRQVDARWHAIYRRNRAVIGADPDLIRPGQVLTITKEH